MVVIVFDVFHYSLEITNKWEWRDCTDPHTQTQLTWIVVFLLPSIKMLLSMAEQCSSTGAPSTMKAKEKACFKPRRVCLKSCCKTG